MAVGARAAVPLTMCFESQWIGLPYLCQTAPVGREVLEWPDTVGGGGVPPLDPLPPQTKVT